MLKANEQLENEKEELKRVDYNIDHTPVFNDFIQGEMNHKFTSSPDNSNLLESGSIGTQTLSNQQNGTPSSNTVIIVNSKKEEEGNKHIPRSEYNG